jgi:hypothetical protein
MIEDGVYSHSVVPGGFEVKSNRTRDTPGTCSIAFTIFLMICVRGVKEKERNKDDDDDGGQCPKNEL